MRLAILALLLRAAGCAALLGVDNFALVVKDAVRKALALHQRRENVKKKSGRANEIAQEHGVRGEDATLHAVQPERRREFRRKRGGKMKNGRLG